MSIADFRAVTLQAVQALGPLFNSGFLAWFLLYALLVALCTKDKRMVLALVPALALWGCFLLAAPSDDCRYMLGIHPMVPLPIAFLTVAGNGGQAVFLADISPMADRKHLDDEHVPLNHA